MSIADKITSITGHLEDDYKALETLGVSVEDRNIENIKDMANQIYAKFPKTSYAEGSNITLSNTLKGKLDFEDGIVGIGDTKQEIDLTENNLTSQSANGLTITVNTDKSITINGTATANTTINILNNTSNNTPATERTLQAGTYSLTGCPSGSDSGTKFKLDVVRSGYISLLDSGSGDIKTLTSSQIYTYIRIQIFNGTQCNNLVFRPKLLKIPSPSYPQDIEVVTGNQDVVVSGKNLFIPTLANNGTNIIMSNISNASVTNGEFNFTASGLDMYFGNVRPAGQEYIDNRGIKVYKNGHEKISFKLSNSSLGRTYVTAYNSSGISLGYTEIASAQGTYTFPDSCDFVSFRFGTGGATVGTTYKTTIMVAYGDTIPTYEPYITPTSYQLSLGDIELCGIGDYKDELVYDVDEDRVYKNEKIGKYLLTGQETINRDTPNNRFELDNLVDILHLQARQQTYCNRYKYVSSGSADYGMFAYWNGAITQVFIYDKDYTQSSDLQSYFANNETYFCYIRNTPILKEITDTTLINQVKALYTAQSINGTTIITSNGNLPMIIKCRGLKGE